MREELFPYEILSRDLILKIQSASLDRYENRTLQQDDISQRSINPERNEIFLWAEENMDWEFLSLVINVEIPKADRHKIDDKFDLIATINCGKTNFRQSFPLKSSNDRNTWYGRITLDRRQFFGKVEMQCVLIGEALGRKSRFFAESSLWNIYFDEAQSPPIQGAIPIQWINFKDTSDLIELKHLRKYAHETHYLAIQDVSPTLYLNSGFEGLPDLFSENPRPRGFHLALFETTISSIAKSVWLAMFQTALAGIKKNVGDIEFDWPEVTWQMDILHQLLPHIYPELGKEAALQKAGNDLNSGDVNRLLSEALAVINQKIINEGKTVRKAIYQMQ